MKALAKSITDFGNVVPVIIDQNNMIVDGEHRVTVYRDKLGLKEIPAIRVHLASDAERKLMRQTLNKLKGYADREKDAFELNELRDVGLLNDLSDLIAIDTPELEKLMEVPTDVEEDNEEKGNDLTELTEEETAEIDQVFPRIEDNPEEGNDYPPRSPQEKKQQQQQKQHDKQAYVLTFEFEKLSEFTRVVDILQQINPKSMNKAILELVEIWRT